jgi:hypothetical protein
VITVYKKGCQTPSSPSVSNIPSDSQHLCVRESKNTGETKKLTMMIYCK